MISNTVFALARRASAAGSYRLSYILLAFLIVMTIGTCMAGVASAAAPPFQWEQIGSAPSSDYNFVDQAADGNYIAIGYGASPDRPWVPYVEMVKLDPSGNVIWDRFVGPEWAWGNAARRTADGGYIIVGQHSNDAYVIKTDAEGNPQWDNNFHFAGWNIIDGVTQTADGGYALVGYIQDWASNPQYVLLIRLDSGGGYLWHQTYMIEGWRNVGMSVNEAPDGSFIIAGSSAIDDRVESFNGFLLKTDSGGFEQWRKLSDAPDYDIFDTALPLSDGTCLVSGITTVVHGHWAPMISRVQADETSWNTLWATTFADVWCWYAGWMLGDDPRGSITLAGDGSYLYSKESINGNNCDLLLTKFDADGNIAWQGTYGSGNNEFGRMASPAADGGYIACGQAEVPAGGAQHGYVIKLGAAQLPPMKLDLSPETATNIIGGEHTVTAAVTYENGGPVAGQAVSFEVTAGPNHGLTGSATTDDNGHATWAYSSSAIGTDAIRAWTLDQNHDNAVVDDSASKCWLPVASKDFRYTDVDFGQQPASLGGRLPDADNDGKYDVRYVLNKKGVASTNPGQLYSVLTVAGIGLQTVNIADSFGSQFDVNPGKLEGGVEILRVAANGAAIILSGTSQVTSCEVDNSGNTVNIGISLATPLGADERLMIYVKYKTALKGQTPDSSDFVNSAFLVASDLPGELATATVEFV